MRLSATALTLVLLTGTAHAAEWNSMWRQEKYCPAGSVSKVGYCDPVSAQKQRKIDEAYQAKIKSQPAPAPVATDPWGNMRASDTVPGQLKGGPKPR